MKNQMKGKKGITLIALVITIIVLLILAGVTIATLTGDNGLLQKATDAKQANEEAAALEKILVEVMASYKKNGTIDIENKLNQNLKKIDGLTYNDNEIDLNDPDKIIIKLPATVKVNGKAYIISENGSVDKDVWINNNGSYTNNATGQTLTVGDTVKYETILNANAVDGNKLTQLKSDLQNYSGDSTSTDNANIARDNLTWKILDVKDGQIRLISATSTTKKIKLYGYNGYNNAVYLLDDACDILYSSNKGISQNLKIENIQETIDKTKFDYTQYENSYVNPKKYKGIIEYDVNLTYPNIYPLEIGCKAITNINNNKNTLNLSYQHELISGKNVANGLLKVSQTNWTKSMLNTDFINQIYYTLFIKNGSNYYNTYWLSSRCIDCGEKTCAFLVRRVYNENVDYYYTFNSKETSFGDSYAFRPVVTLNSDVQLEPDGTNTWKIK